MDRQSSADPLNPQRKKIVTFALGSPQCPAAVAIKPQQGASNYPTLVNPRGCRMGSSIPQPAQYLAPLAGQALIPPWLTHFGAFGLFCVAAIDSSVIPLPLPGSTDLLLLWLVAYGGNPWSLAAFVIAGSILGGYTTWDIGRRGGEAALRHYLPTRLLGRIVGWVEHHKILSVFLPALLPPPIPLLPFALASGALGVSRNRFLLVYSAARCLRYSLIASLGVFYGRHLIRLWTGTLQKWLVPLLCVFIFLLIIGACYGIWKVRCIRRVEASEKYSVHHDASLPV